MRSNVRIALLTAVVALLASPAGAQVDFVLFESGPVRPLALSPDETRLYAVNTPDNRLEVFSVAGGVLTHIDSIPVGMEPVAVAARSNSEVWVVNHLSDSVSVIDTTATPPKVVRTLLVGDEPRDIVFAGTGGNRAFISTAHRGQHRLHASIDGVVTGGGDPQLTTEGIGRADVWVFDATDLGITLGGTPVEILSFFADTPRALATSPDGNTVYVAGFHSGNQTTVINETVVNDGFGGFKQVPNPDDNIDNVSAPETGVIVKWDGANWRDVANQNWSSDVNLFLPDHDVFAVNANTLVHGQVFDHVGTTLFNMVANPISGNLYVTNTESPNNVRFEGPGNHGGSTVQGHLSESRITVIDPSGPSVAPKHLNIHLARAPITYDNHHTDGGANHAAINAQIPHSLATPVQSVVTALGDKIYTAAFGSAKIGVFDTADIEDANFDTNFDPETESANYIDTAGGPAGLVLDEGSNRLYVLTRFNNSVQVVNLGTSSVVATHALHNPEPTSVIDGRPFLYDAANTSGNGEASCSSCHIFGDMDSLSWNLGDPDASISTNTQKSASPNGLLPQPDATFHPMKGPMTTQTLRGLATEGGMHWRGDRVDGHFGTDPCPDNAGGPSGCNEALSFRNFIVAFEGLVGHEGLIPDADMNKFTNFALQIMLPPNPIRNLDNTLTASQAAGRAVFHECGDPGDCALGLPPEASDTVEDCEGCHELNPANGFFGGAGQATFEGEPQSAKVPHMRNLYQKIGMFGISTGGPFLGDQVRGTGFLHDGSVDTVFNFVSAGVFTLTNQEKLDIEQFALAFPTDLAPIVGQQVTLSAPCTDDFDSGGPPQNSGSPDNLCDVDGVTPVDDADNRVDLMLTRSGTAFTSLTLGGVVTECDVIAKGTVGSVERGWYWDGALWQDDFNGSISDAGLRALATTEGPLTFTAVPPGAGERMGIDRDQDSLGDGVETNTGVFVNGQDTGTDPTLFDTDGDGYFDGLEVDAGSDPNDPLSFPAGVPAMGDTGMWLLVLALMACTFFAVHRRRAVAG